MHWQDLYYYSSRVHNKLLTLYSQVATNALLKSNNVVFAGFSTIGVPLLDKHRSSVCVFGDGLTMVNVARFATLGKANPCKFYLGPGGKVRIGKRVSMSNATIASMTGISIGNNVMIGAGVSVLDSDFHSLDPSHWGTPHDSINARSSPVVIGNDVFIGMDSIVLKGVNIGSGVVISAGSVVTCNIPPNEIWGGNPARFLKQKVLVPQEPISLPLPISLQTGNWPT